MKKIIGLIAIFGLLMLLMGCTEEEIFRDGHSVPVGGGDDPDDGNNVQTTKPDDININYNEPKNISYGWNAKAPTDIYFINVGYGDAILIQKGDFEMLIDVSGSEAMGNRVVNFVNGLNIDDIEVLVLTLPLKDHIGGIKPVLKNLEIEEIWDNGEMKDNEAYMDYVYYREKYVDDVTVKQPVHGDSFNFNGMDITIINPDEKRTDTGELTQNSLTMMIQDENFSMLTTDMQPNKLNNQLSDLYGENVPNVDIYKVPYHGGTQLAPPLENMKLREVIRNIRPDYGIISVGPNMYGGPNLAVIGAFQDNDVTLLNTMDNGTIKVSYNDLNYDVETTPSETS